MFFTIKSEIFSLYISRKDTRTRNLSVLLGKLSISGRERRREGKEEGGGVRREGVKEFK